MPADAQKFVKKTPRREQRMFAVASGDYPVALRFHCAIMDCCGDRPVRLDDLSINPVLTQVSTGNGHGLPHGLLIALLGGEYHQGYLVTVCQIRSEV